MTIREAADYFHIGGKKLRQIVDEDPYAEFIIMNGNRAVIKRKRFERYPERAAAVRFCHVASAETCGFLNPGVIY